jgi:tetratricopeptide (TPR) repeat protein
MEKSDNPENRVRHSLRVLRPLFWWLILVLILYGIRTHERLMEQTRLDFNVSLQGLPVDATVTLDGSPAFSGQKISLGRHIFAVTHPKAESFSTNLFIWYGRHDLGQIKLKRSTGTLSVQAKPPAPTITITGPEFSTTLYACAGTNLTVPTDQYVIRAEYPHWSQSQHQTVFANQTAPCVFAPSLGALHVACNKEGATYRLDSANDQAVDNGNLPATVAALPAGEYELTVSYHNQVMQKSVRVEASVTNDVPFHFAFGAARFESVPPGASVYTVRGIHLGTTPVVVTELPASTADYRLQLNGYDGATVSVTVVENQTNVGSATLVSLSYLGSMRLARQDMEAGNYKNALASVAQALIAKPGDADALNLQTAANGRELVQEAKALATQGDYITAGQKVQAALEILPGDSEAKTLQAGYKTQEPQQLAQLKENQTRAIFDRICRDTPVASLFEANEYKTGRMSPEETKNALVKCYADQWPKAVASVDQTEEPGIYKVLFVQASSSPLETARREMMCVFGPAKDGQTLILFKCLEYQRRASSNLTDALLGANNPNNWIPLNSSRIQMTPAYEEQVSVGIRMMLKKIKQAVGETTSF